MIVMVANETYDCSKAVRDEDQVTLYLSAGGTVTFMGVSDWDAYSLQGGEWSPPDVTPEEQLRADIDYIAIMTGVSL